MLVLTRKVGQKIIIGDNIELTVVEVRGDAVRLGIMAPKNVTVYREELYQEICQANKTAQTPTTANKLDQLGAFGNSKGSASPSGIIKRPPQA